MKFKKGDIVTVDYKRRVFIIENVYPNIPYANSIYGEAYRCRDLVNNEYYNLYADGKDKMRKASKKELKDARNEEMLNEL